MLIDELFDAIYRNVTLKTARWHLQGIGSQIGSEVIVDNLKNVEETLKCELVPNAIERLHSHNYNVWHHEDVCRSDRVGDVYPAKRIIDKNNQARCDCVEELDDDLFIVFNSNRFAPINSETPGSIIDRVSINELKIYHVEELIGGGDRKDLEPRLKHLICQKRILLQCLENLLLDMRAGKRTVFIYKQHKMYNDPSTNPLHRDRK